MAYYAALVSVVQLLEEITYHDRYPNCLLDIQEMASLHEKFKHLQELLDKQESAGSLEWRIRDAAYHAQDIIESHISNLVPEQGEDLGLVKNLTMRSHRFQLKKNKKNPVPEQLEDLEKVKVDIHFIVEEMMKIKRESLTIHQDNSQEIRYSGLNIEASNIQIQSGRSTKLVFDEQLMTTIKEQLCGQSSRLEAISVIGMGGLGKTTLAGNIFDDKLIKGHFDCHAWVTVSQDYHLQKFLHDIVNSLNIKHELDGVGQEMWPQHIYKHLYGRRYLIIMDDIWDTKVWDDIRRILPNNSNGSRVMITTRLSDVAVHASSSGFSHQMEFLNEDQSWILLQDRVFAQEHCPEELKVIGKLIAKNCRGLPLAIVVVAGVLSKVNKARHDWEKIAKNVSSSAIDHNGGHLSNILSLSYNHLPHHLRPCFLYLGGFPEDYELRVSTLIRLWVAEGFLKPIASKGLEEVGEEYFKDLVDRNLVLITQKTINGEFKCCSMHDLLRDLCTQRAHYENFLHCIHKKDDFPRGPEENVQRLSIQMRKNSLFGKFVLLFGKYKMKHVSHVRSIISFVDWTKHDQFLSDCKLLRILDTTTTLDDLTFTANFKLMHLRYLRFLAASQIHIPPFILKLQNLQTLIVLQGRISLPSEIWKMPQLRHLIFQKATLAPIPYDDIRIIDGVPLLGSLQTLQKVTDFIFTRDSVEMIPNLKKLKVAYLTDPVEAHNKWEELGLKNLVHLRQLETLNIHISRWMKVAQPLPENFDFPRTLIKLTLSRCTLLWKDMRFVGSLPNLQVLKLEWKSFVGEEWETVEGEFSRLQFLQMYLLNDLKYWRTETNHFPCLEQLHMKCCSNLVEIPSEIGDISTLQLIRVSYSKLAADSALKIQEEQRDLGNDDLQVHVYPQEFIWQKID